MAINPLSLVLPQANTAGNVASGSGNAGEGFGSILQKAIQNTIGAQTQASSMTEALANGADMPVHEVVQAISRAELTLQTLITVRDKAIEAYQEIQRMPI